VCPWAVCPGEYTFGDFEDFGDFLEDFGDFAVFEDFLEDLEDFDDFGVFEEDTVLTMLTH
jgi:hypothetical protein